MAYNGRPPASHRCSAHGVGRNRAGRPAGAVVWRTLLSCGLLAWAAVRSDALVARPPLNARSVGPAALGMSGGTAWRAGAPLLARPGVARRSGALMAARSGERRPEANDGDGGKKNENPFFLRLLLLAATSSAAMLARIVRPLARGLAALDALLRAPAPRGGLTRNGLAQRLARLTSALAVMAAIAYVAGALGSAGPSAAPPVEVAYSSFLKLVESGAPVGAVEVSPRRLSFALDGRAHFARPVLATPSLLEFLMKKGVDFRAPTPSAVEGLGRLILPVLWFGGIMAFYARQARQMTGGAGKRAASGELGAALSFDDVQGIARAKSEVAEIVTMLKNPAKYLAAGVRLPSGILLAGPPGTGKTLLARVLASEAGVPFFFCSGSDFVEVFVGRGASRLRSLFEKARKVAPCVIFIDELDALGKRRSLRIAGSNDEAEQTLNQLLASMDGVDSSLSGVIVVGATNRASLLDPALIRPGRFDRIVQLELPDVQGRTDILKVHAKKMQLAPDVSLAKVAELGTGMSGAELASICNEAAIRMVRRSGSTVSQADFESAVKDYIKSRQLAPLSLIDKFMLGQA